MATNQQKHWYNDGEIFRQGFIQSTYITAITDWFMGLAGKATVLVLYFTVLYSCIQLYPKVNLPDGLSLAVFIIQMGALDIGGLSLGTLARQAKKAGNILEATQASRLSKALITIMLLGVVTVSIGHVVTIESHWLAGIQIVQVVARSICAVLYGRVVHDLKQETREQNEQEVTDMVTALLNSHMEQVALQTQKNYTEFSNSLQSMTELVRQNVALNDKNISENEQRIAFFLWHELQGFTEGIKQELEQLKAIEKPLLSGVSPTKKTEGKGQEKQAFQSDEKDTFIPDFIEDYNDVLPLYPAIASWLSTGRKTATLEEIAEATEKSLRMVRNRAEKGMIKRSGRNANLYSIVSVLAWLKQEVKQEMKSKVTRELPALKLVKNA